MKTRLWTVDCACLEHAPGHTTHQRESTDRELDLVPFLLGACDGMSWACRLDAGPGKGSRNGSGAEDGRAGDMIIYSCKKKVGI